ncbi:MAG: hypothetical protein JNK09_17115 [Prolixibacteraceae bacterium]|nr:hypothetical protein [Prolixibacteraceae bacterium]
MPMKFLDHFDHSERKQDKEHFIHLIQIANADGKIDDAEMQMLYRMGSKLGLTQTEVDDLLKSTGKSAYIPPYELSKRFEQLYDVIKMVYADGEIDDKEMKMASALAIKSGFAEEDLSVLLSVLVEGIKAGEDEEDLFNRFRKKRMGK